MIEYQVLRSRRKTLSLQVKYGQVFVRAPFHLDEQFISSFIQKKDAWLKAKVSEQSQTADLCCDFTQGSKLYLFGNLVSLNIIFTSSVKKTDVFLSSLNDSHQELVIVFSKRSQQKLADELQLAVAVKKRIEHYLKEQAHNIIQPKVEYYALLTQLAPTAIKIRQYRARWGSCNNRGEVSFNYLLMMLPVDVIDYVIVHELCHLRHLNHSKNFWQLVAQHFPGFIEAKKWIKSNQSALHWRTPV